MSEEFELGEFDFADFLQASDPEDAASPQGGSRLSLQVVFAIDASNSMQGYKIGAVNDCVNNVISKLRSIAHSRRESIEVSVVGFSTRLFRWTNAFVPVERFDYSYVEMVDGLTDVNALLRELVVLSENHMDDDSRKFVVLFSDGLPTESYGDSLKSWTQTKHYKSTYKIVLAFDDDIADPQSLEFFRDFIDSGSLMRIQEQEDLLGLLLGE